jgi:hypothetical protein
MNPQFDARRIDLSPLQEQSSVEHALVNVGGNYMSVGATQAKRILCVPSLAYWRKQRGLTAKRLFERSGIDDVWIEHLEWGD